MPYVTNQDIQLYYEVNGKGLPLLIISGLSGGTWSWYGQVPFFKNHYLTIAFDNRGAGRSTIPLGQYEMSQFAEDALRILDALAVDQVFVLALSMGGMIAQELALMAPSRIKAMVLGCTHCGGESRIPPSDWAIQVLLNNAGLTQEQIIDKNLPLFFSQKFRQDRQETIAQYRVAQLKAPLQPEHAFLAQLAAIASFDRCRDLSRISNPSLIITGSEDILVPPGNSHNLNKRISKSRLIEIPGAAHALHVECRDQLNALVHAFFQECTA